MGAVYADAILYPPLKRLIDHFNMVGFGPFPQIRHAWIRIFR
jgi:hypothetical protein